jgi:hypothetical protein
LRFSRISFISAGLLGSSSIGGLKIHGRIRVRQPLGPILACLMLAQGNFRPYRSEKTAFQA